MEALPSFLGDKDVVVDVPGLGRVKLEYFLAFFLLNPVAQVTLDLAFGGMWYAIVAAEQVTEKSGKSSLSKVGLTLEPEHGKKIAKLGEMIKVASHSRVDFYSLPR